MILTATAIVLTKYNYEWNYRDSPEEGSALWINVMQSPFNKILPEKKRRGDELKAAKNKKWISDNYQFAFLTKS